MRISHLIKKSLTFCVSRIFVTGSYYTPMDPVLILMNQAHILTPYIYKICFNIIVTSMPKFPKLSFAATFC
jgi:hypothetical protein